jgi:hypothetical protein
MLTGGPAQDIKAGRGELQQYRQAAGATGSFPSFLLRVWPDCTIQRANDFRSWPQPAERAGVSMWNEREMPERWYGLLRERMQVEEQRMRVIKDGDVIEHDDLEELMAQADSLDRAMLLVMRQAIAEAIEADTSAASLHARSAEWRAGLSRFFPSDFA